MPIASETVAKESNGQMTRTRSSSWKYFVEDRFSFPFF